ncbi:hypothetical protein QF205_07030 [Luteimonas composti]|uniref:Addiction module antidote protein n=1 Tax=Luteimonas composti TaxID=398257 RepID=A0ABT6MQD7_9GAMM|nr:hypothetical protein [Luteimonas composti]MDH7452835.1 hypothetical protein [Luteimonas composti]
MKVKTSPFDAAYFLDSDEAIAAYLTDALREDDAVLLRNAMLTVVRAFGIGAVAEVVGLGWDTVCDALESGDVQTLRSVVQATADCLTGRAAD